MRITAIRMPTESNVNQSVLNLFGLSSTARDEEVNTS
jgi:hypothetical protein